MCRKNCTIGVGLMALGIGILGGFCLGSWFLCACSSLSLIALGFLILKRR